MSRPTSFRLPEELLAGLEQEACESGSSVSALVATLLDEGLKSRRFREVVYRDGRAGRRAGLIDGPDLWEIVRDLKQAPGKGEKRLQRLAADTGLNERQITVAADFYACYPEEIDRLIEADERAAVQAKEVIARREQLLSS